MAEWWAALGGLNRAFYALAVFFSTIFLWQVVSSLAGLGGAGEAAEVEGGPEAGGLDMADTEGADDLIEDASGLATFRLFSVRSILAFGTLFSWAGALYLQQDLPPGWALARALLWGLLGMVVVGAFFWLLPRLSEEGTGHLASAVGETGQVYINIPQDGLGQVRVIVGGRVSFVKARARGGQALPAGTPVRVVGLIDSLTLEVEPEGSRAQGL
jgi:membrane protein implicated in regulation of membrane protease activity